jgi:hypothetical protein
MRDGAFLWVFAAVYSQTVRIDNDLYQALSELRNGVGGDVMCVQVIERLKGSVECLKGSAVAYGALSAVDE